ncbi:MAG: MBL fold metallo-hydrolase [Spirochaetales bacterium]|nr:MBL fold metallo-hydrolase [Spirochaetales bacterium]MCF7939127.1 MBL fold metallo-hydrolase [Spirochaetales bacterium]
MSQRGFGRMEGDRISSWWQAGFSGSAAGETQPSKPFQPSVRVAWLGQAGFALRRGNLRLVFDPYLSDSLAEKYRDSFFPHKRMMPVPVAPERLAGTDLVLVTHEHSDHMDPGTLPALAGASPEARIVLPRFSIIKALERKIPGEQIVAVDVGERWSAGPIEVEPVPAVHEEMTEDSFGNHKFLGYLVTVDGFTVYHAGDTIPHPSIDAVLRKRKVDLALLPVNGRDVYRKEHGVPGNLTGEEALEMHERLDFSHTIVHHFGMFDFNSADIGELQAIIRNKHLQKTITVPEAGRIYEY